MCFGLAASWAMIGAGAAATVITLRRGEAPAIPATLAFFAGMEALQAAGYAVIDQCGNPANQAVTLASYLHIALQPLFINAFCMAIAPAPPSPGMRRAVWLCAGLASALLLARLLPGFGACRPGEVLCGPAWCTVTGTWHLAWDMPLNGLWRPLAELTGWPMSFPDYMLGVFVLPLVYGAWRFVLMHAALGPVLATWLTDMPNEMPAVWCLFSIGLLAIGLSPAVRRAVAGPRPCPA
ncbi:MAG: DUF5765 domain-containing protein [Rhodobacteraceae bacterium]|nr:DUF5765 domain-containing protein [Paracoccaceae bacterium]